jgi:hypothetical protein
MLVSAPLLLCVTILFAVLENAKALHRGSMQDLASPCGRPAVVRRPSDHAHPGPATA